MTLAELQERFQAGILSEGSAAPDCVADSKRTDASTLFAIYHNAYRLRLAEFLSNDYPVLRNYLDDQMFGALVEAYIVSAPSHVTNARWYGARLPEFMRDWARLANDVQAIDMARFERALANAFDAADGPRLSLDTLASVVVSFAFHPSWELLDLATGTAARYEAARDGEELPPIQEGEEHVLFWRSADNQSSYRIVAPQERLALIEAAAGKSFAEICSLLQFFDSSEGTAVLASQFLAQWFADGLVVRLLSKDRCLRPEI
ncbi:DNA-binding domain-containing protein [Methylocystis echinoides]|uniref:Putative DNA-binding domain-containing protein n=1 Tax=Methylocystis echinoides TaxID=29468 RepID=A0A9W6LU67_9HYPH|nr:DNA-binding domain-containing protein [Methylocystis echinoides]GLI95495.1 hypothetical protein LMG27198_44870 [Methylocystis echinoides]